MCAAKRTALVESSEAIVRVFKNGLGSPVFDKLEAELAKAMLHPSEQRV